ncbi:MULTISPECIES: hypothetical protein [unclassified Duganella]|uniref:hypothetical protein n=1 Tax=unclassified Duganella TaxID=2636909 RepID=UPI0006F4752D|nr:MULTISPECIES: hypothetical protein [unclassified Duganella]KQV53656.1 hypothetical protein ASD07_03615 [Duganella sp. Root336D2]KRB83790.1 hypothetical protein ASE26_11570 [Duganella sp. Root198D2]
MATSINGIGTTFYGQAGFEPDGSFITTKWVIFAYLPIIPTASMRVRYAGEENGFFSSGTSYQVIMDYPIDIGQVLRTWAYVISFITLLTLLDKGEGSGWKAALLCAMALLPHTLRWFARRWAMDDYRNASQRTSQRANANAKPAPNTRLEDLPRVSTCPKCRYTRKADDYAPAWQCPSCKVAYNKVSN